MGDRVAIIGGSTVGRDHFPFPNVIADLSHSSGSYTNWPLIVDLGAACSWFYLVRRWKFDLSVNYDIYTSGTFVDSDAATVSVVLEPNCYTQDFTPFQPTRECDLVCDRRIGYFFSFDPDNPILGTEDGVSDYSNTWPDAAKFSLSLSVYFGAPQFASGQFYFRFRLAFATDNGAGGTSTAVTDDNLADGDFGDVQVDGNQVLLSYENNPSGLGTEYMMNPGGAIALTPVLFWPYATKAGLPVWDAATGAQLRDPFS